MAVRELAEHKPPSKWCSSVVSMSVPVLTSLIDGLEPEAQAKLDLPSPKLFLIVVLFTVTQREVKHLD